MAVPRIREIKKTLNPNILFLMETKNQDEFVLSELLSLRYDHHITVPPIGLSGGLTLFWKADIDISILEATPHFIDTKLKVKNTEFHVTFIYGMPQQENRAAFWESISQLGRDRDTAWLLSGDFNDILDNVEKVGGPERCEGSFIPFRSFVSENGLWDVKHVSNPLLWRGQRCTHFIRARLDRALANCACFDMFPAGRCDYLRFEGSDHRPLVTYLDSSKPKRRRLFRYDRNIKDMPEARKVIEEAWQKDVLKQVENKIKRCCEELIKWFKTKKENSAKAIIDLQSILEEHLSCGNPSPEIIRELSLALSKAYKEEELYWRQRSRVQWLQGGDRNSAYFHAVTKRRRSYNRLTTIEDEAGIPFHEETEIGKVFEDYYTELFTSNGAGGLGAVEEAISRRISPETNQILTAIPTDTEILCAVKQINTDKAPGPDGFSAGFYHSFWEVIGEDICREVRDFFLTGKMDPKINETHICLLPKVSGAKSPSEFRPIALCNVRYKIIAKILTLRLQKFLDHIVSKQQSTFVPGRAITDNILITHENLHYLKVSEATKRRSMVIKTDMSKAYDRIEWDFIAKVLNRLVCIPHQLCAIW